MGRTLHTIILSTLLTFAGFTAHADTPTEASCTAEFERALAEINAPKAIPAPKIVGDGETLYVSSEPPGPFVMEGVRGPTVKRKAKDAAREAYRECLFSVPLPPNPDGTCPFGTSPIEVTPPQSFVAFNPSNVRELKPVTRLKAIPLKPSASTQTLQSTPRTVEAIDTSRLQVTPARPPITVTPPKPAERTARLNPSLKPAPVKPVRRLKPDAATEALKEPVPLKIEKSEPKLDPALMKRLKVSPALMKAAPKLKVETFRFEKIAVDQIRLREESGADIKCLPDSTNQTLLYQIVQIPKLYMTGAPVKVAFNGGSRGMRMAIYSIAQQWALNSADPVTGERLIEFDFGAFQANGLIDFNEWSPDDVRYAAHIRINFNPADGYWSFIGTDSADPDVVLPGEPSMNLAGMDGYSALPQDWIKTIFHEFGHALGLEHEHQHPTSVCGDALRLEDDEGYTLTLDDYGMTVNDAEGDRPGVLTYLEHYPNYWSREDAIFNLAQLQEDDDRFTTAFDPTSIMRYEFPLDWYKDAAPDECLPLGDAPDAPSPADYAAIRIAYQQQLCTEDEFCEGAALGPVASPE